MWYLTPITEEDIDRVYDIEQSSFPLPWSRELLLQEILRKGAHNYVVKRSDVSENRASCEPVDTIAYVCFRIIADEMHIMKIAVAPDWRRKGVALWLLEKSLEIALEKGAMLTFLEVRPSNHSAIKLYNKLGFKTVGKRLNYYSGTREDALVMMRTLKEEICQRKLG